MRVFYGVKFSRKGQVQPPGFKHPLYFRAKNRSDIYTFQEIFIRRDYEYDFPRPVRTIIDAGSNLGYAAIYFARKYPKARIICLEPDPENFSFVEKNTAGYDQITAVNKALWKSNDDIVIINPQSHNRGYMVGEQQGDEATTLGAISPTSLMSAFNLEEIDIFKIDIEGAEQEVFEADPEVWLSKTNSLFIELHDRMKPLSSQPVFRAVSQHPFMFDKKGENLIFYRQ